MEAFTKSMNRLSWVIRPRHDRGGRHYRVGSALIYSGVQWY
jgi:hypothetical protein